MLNTLESKHRNRISHCDNTVGLVTSTKDYLVPLT